MEWPQRKSFHAATHLSGPLFVIVGGSGRYGRTLNDMWLCDTTTKRWKKVLFLIVTVLSVHNKQLSLCKFLSCLVLINLLYVLLLFYFAINTCSYLQSSQSGAKSLETFCAWYCCDYYNISCIYSVSLWYNVMCCCCIIFFSYHYLMSMLLNDAVTQYQHYSWDHIACGWYCLEGISTKLTLSLLN